VADDLRGLQLRADPYEAATGASVVVVLTEWDEFRWLDFTRVPRSWLRPPSSTPATCWIRLRCGAWVSPTTGSDAGEPVVVAGGPDSWARTCAIVLIARGDSVICLDDLSTGNRENVAHLLGNERFTLVVTDVSEKVELEGREQGRRRVQPGQPGLAAGLLSPAPRDTLAVGSEGTRRLLELAREHEARFLMASTSEIYGDPEVHPQVESYRGNVDPPVRAASTTRPSGSPRADHGHAS
jgi:hypothetical protein